MKSMAQMHAEMFAHYARLRREASPGAEYPKLRFEFPGIVWIARSREEEVAHDRFFWIGTAIGLVIVVATGIYSVWRFA